MGHFIFIFFFSLNDNDYLPFSHPCISIGLRDSVLQHCSLYTSQSNQFTDFLWYRLHVSSSVWTLPFPFFLSLSLYLSHWFFSSFLLNFCGCSLAAEIQSLKIYSNVIQRIRGVLNTQRSFSGRTWNDFICKISEWVSDCTMRKQMPHSIRQKIISKIANMWDYEWAWPRVRILCINMGYTRCYMRAPLIMNSVWNGSIRFFSSPPDLNTN